jgi:hypothetical protein
VFEQRISIKTVDDMFVALPNLNVTPRV